MNTPTSSAPHIWCQVRRKMSPSRAGVRRSSSATAARARDGLRDRKHGIRGATGASDTAAPGTGRGRGGGIAGMTGDAVVYRRAASVGVLCNMRGTGLVLYQSGLL